MCVCVCVCVCVVFSVFPFFGVFFVHLAALSNYYSTDPCTHTAGGGISVGVFTDNQVCQIKSL